MTKQKRTVLKDIVERIKKKAYEEGFSAGYKKGLEQDVMDE